MLSIQKLQYGIFLKKKGFPTLSIAPFKINLYFSENLGQNLLHPVVFVTYFDLTSLFPPKIKLTMIAGVLLE